VHLAYLGHPLTGDFLYGQEGTLSRPALHSAQLAFLHPMTGEKLTFSQPLPPDMAALLAEGENF
jgi:23S rRNA pseudouridine1911/1915/1917 synthase